jgi:hypothetical protein
MSLQICEIHDLGILKPQLGSPTSFSHFNVASITNHRIFSPYFHCCHFGGYLQYLRMNFGGASKGQIVGMSKEDLEGRHEKIRR